MFVLELLGVKWSDEYDNEVARRPALQTVIESDDIDETWFMTQLDRFDDYRGSWRDYRNFEVARRFEERVDVEEFRERFDRLYEDAQEE